MLVLLDKSVDYSVQFDNINNFLPTVAFKIVIQVIQHTPCFSFPTFTSISNILTKKSNPNEDYSSYSSCEYLVCQNCTFMIVTKEYFVYLRCLKWGEASILILHTTTQLHFAFKLLKDKFTVDVNARISTSTCFL